MSMLGSRGADTTLSTLSNLIANPAKLQKAMADLQASTEKHRAERDAAIKQKADAAEVVARVNERLAFLEQREAEVKASQGQLDAARAVLRTDQARHEATVAAFNDSKEKTVRAHQVRVDADRKEITDANAALVRDKERQDAAVSKAAAELKDAQAKVDTQSRALDRLRAELDRRAQALTALELDVRGRIKKINELFPVT